MYEFGTDFVARCIAGEGLETAIKRQWKLKAGPGVILSDNPNTEETTISVTGEDYTAGTGIDITNGVISLDADYGASFEMTIDPNTYVVTAVLKDQNGNTLGQAQTIDLPLESVVVNGRYDTATKTIILTLEGGSTISIPVGDLVSGLESTTNKVTLIGSSSTNTEYPSAKAVYDAIQDIDEVPDATAADEGKVLTVDANGDAEWVTPSAGVTDYTLLDNKPSINNVELNGNKTAAELGLVDSSELNNYLTISSAANTYQPKGIGVGKNVDDTSFTLDGTTYTADTGCEVFNHSPYDMTTNNKTSGYYSHVEGANNIIATDSGTGNHAEGEYNTIIGSNGNHIEGQNNRINSSGTAGNHVEGQGNTLTATGGAHHMEGVQNTISGSVMGCHAEGAQNTASGVYAHVEGGGNTASGEYSHAQGMNTVASGAESTAAGFGTIAAGNSQVAIGKYNVATANDDIYPLVVGNGTGNNNRSDCFKIDKTGKIYVGNNPDGVDVTAIKEVPDAAAADTGKVLTVTGADTYAWSAVPTPSVDEVPDVTSTDDGKVLTATYSGGVGSYNWTSPQTFSQQQADWAETDTTAVDYIQNKPSLAAVATSGNYSDLSGTPSLATVATSGNYDDLTNKPNLSNYVTTSDISDMATQTWVGQQGYMTSADEVPTVTSSDDGKVLTATYSGGTGSYSWQTPTGGGLQVETDGTNYWVTVNGIRLYFASSAPTGTIPDGSMGIGW